MWALYLFWVGSQVQEGFDAGVTRVSRQTVLPGSRIQGRVMVGPEK